VAGRQSLDSTWTQLVQKCQLSLSSASAAPDRVQANRSEALNMNDMDKFNRSLILVVIFQPNLI
jgi:hypothetical protein